MSDTFIMGMNLFKATFGFMLFFILVLDVNTAMATPCDNGATCASGELCQARPGTAGPRLCLSPPVNADPARCPQGCLAGNVCTNTPNSTGFSCRRLSSIQESAACNQQFRRLITACQAEVTSTASNCDERNNQELNTVDAAAQVALGMGQQASASVQNSCSTMGSLLQAANAALAGYRLICTNALAECHSVCARAKAYATANAECLSPGGNASSVVSYIQEATTEGDECKKFDAKPAQATQGIQNFGAISANASQCDTLTDDGAGTPPPLQLCQAQPTYPGCAAVLAADCSVDNEASRANKVCKCLRNPQDPDCVSGQSNQASLQNPGGSINSASRVGASADNLGDIPDLPGIQPGQVAPGGGAGEAVDGRQGSSSPVGGSGGGNGSGGGRPGAGGAGVDEDGANVNGGFYGGGSGARPGGGSAYDDPRAAAVAAAAGAGRPGGPDLKAFLPGGKYDPRLAGMGGTDGITGPNTNIWKKIQNRYQVMSPTLLP